MKNAVFLALAAAFLAACTPSEPTPPADPALGGGGSGGPNQNEQQK